MNGAVAVRLLPFGDRALLAELDTLADVLTLHARLAATRPPGAIDLVPAARTVLVRVDPALLSLSAARTWVGAAAAADADVPGSAVDAAGDAPAPPSPVVELPVVYDGHDLAATAEMLGMSAEELVRRHAAAEWTVAFTGFAPGFGYLVSADWPFSVPRLDAPRTRVPAGAVALAGEFTGAYPRETPGGWRLIGSTSARLFDADAAAPALLTPGLQVRFVPRAEIASAAWRPAVQAASGAPLLRVAEPGLLATVQDQGRAGHAAEGIAPSGAADRAALRTAQRLVGNREDAAGVEITMGGFRAVALADTWFAVTGAWGPLRLDGHPVDPYSAHRWPAGTELEVDVFAHGIRGYLAVRGGIDAPRTAGSRSRDVLAGLGPAPLHPGAVLTAAGEEAGPVPPEDLHPWGPPADDLVEVALAAGPRATWFRPESIAALYETTWTVSNDIDRVGIRLDGPPLARVGEAELPSEGMLPGAVQVPPSGRPVVFGPDAPVTGGYPVIAVVADADRDLLGQVRPGTRVRFRHAR